MDNTLLVPIELDALVANNQLFKRDTLRWWSFNYASLDKYQSLEPLPFNNYMTGQPAGIYLHWTLPRSLRTGNSAAGSQAYPLVPNRWLILRVARSQSTPLSGWVLESDCPTSPSQPATSASLYLIDPAILALWQGSADNLRRTANVSSTDPLHAMMANLGIPFNQATWTERAASTMFLTAVAPGNAVFSEYVAHNTNIFSFYDALPGIAQDTISYLVTGWYSDQTKDIVVPGPNGYTGATTIQEVLTALNWTVAGNASPAAVTTSVYTGALFSIGWDLNGPPPSPDVLQDIRTNSKLNVAIGNTTIDAFSTLLGQQLVQYENADQTISLLRAFQYDLLPLLNEVNGDSLLEEEVRNAWFASKPGGTRWVIGQAAATGNQEPDSVPPPLTPAEAAWLLQLNIDQQNLDTATRQLNSLQWDLNAAWWKQGHVANLFPPNGQYNAASFAPLLDPTNPGSLLSQVLTQLQTVTGLMSRVPQPIYSAGATDQDAFLAGVTAFATARGISSDKVLKAVAQPRYWKPNNPVVVVSGVEPASSTDTDDALVARLPSQLINFFMVNGARVDANALGATVPSLPNMQVLPAVAAGLILEFFLLDPGNSAVIAAKIGQPAATVLGVMSAHDSNGYPDEAFPAISLSNWTQGWNPMFMEWQINYTYVPFATGSKQNWNFDGTDYSLDPNAVADSTQAQIGGISLLSPHAQNVFGARLNKFVTTYGDQTQLKQLYDWIGQVDQWKFLSQELVDFGSMLTQRDGRAFRRPGVEQFPYGGNQLFYSDVMGFTTGNNPPPYTTPESAAGQVNTVPYILNDVTVPFHGLREGQIYFMNLMLYDKFGRVLNLVLLQSGGGLYDAKNFPLICDAAMNIDRNLTPSISAPAQLPPRLQQFARLDLLLTDQFNDNNFLGAVAGVNPVCGWIIPNHLDQAMSLYASDGTALGELTLIAPLSGARQVNWLQPPNSTLTIAQVQAMAPHMADLITAASGRSESEFDALLGAIDSTLWTVDPLGDRSDQDLTVLIGRPLALVRTTLQFTLDGQPLTDVSWASTFNPPPPDFTGYNFSIRLGDQATRDDGVIGYFIDKNYGLFNSVAPAASGQTYVQQIGPLGGTGGNYLNLPFDNTTTRVITLLVDPRASIHATTGILPVKELKVPQQFIDGPLTNMGLAFRAGPVLTQVLDTSTPDVQELSLLPLTEQNGTWSWWEKTGAGWQNYNLADATPNANMKGNTSTLREGFLNFLLNK